MVMPNGLLFDQPMKLAEQRRQRAGTATVV